MPAPSYEISYGPGGIAEGLSTSVKLDPNKINTVSTNVGGSGGALDPAAYDDVALEKLIQNLRESGFQRPLQPWQSDLLNKSITESSRRKGLATGASQQQIADILGFGGQGQSTVPLFDLSEYQKNLQEKLAAQQGQLQSSLASQQGQLQSSVESQRKYLGDIYNQELQRGLSDISQQFGQQRRSELEERAALGNFASPATYAALQPLEAERSKAIGNLISQLGTERARSAIGLESGLQQQLQRGEQFGMEQALSGGRFGLEQGLRGQEFGAEQGLRERELMQSGRMGLAELMQRSGQFGQTFGLEQQKQASIEREMALNRALGEKQLDVAQNVGRMQAESQKPSVFGQIGGLLGGLGGLAGGIGGLMGGLGGKALGAATQVAGNFRPQTSNYNRPIGPAQNFGYYPQSPTGGYQ